MKGVPDKKESHWKIPHRVSFAFRLRMMESWNSYQIIYLSGDKYCKELNPSLLKTRVNIKMSLSEFNSYLHSTHYHIGS